jgi:hypothetical protein
VEIYYKTDPVLMAQLHSGDGYYGENKNPYEKGTRPTGTFTKTLLKP